jgi:hypothetical protein
LKRDHFVCIKHEHKDVKGYKVGSICTEHNDSIKEAMEVVEVQETSKKFKKLILKTRQNLKRASITIHPFL